MIRKPGQSYYTNRHSCFLLQYHIVLVTKYRHKVIKGSLKEDLYQYIRETFSNRGLNIMELNGEEDHVHILCELDPCTMPKELINALKTRTSRLIRSKYGNTELKKYYWKPYFWSKSYFITTVSENSLQTVQEYIKNQGDKD